MQHNEDVALWSRIYAIQDNNMIVLYARFNYHLLHSSRNGTYGSD
jgi:hypothetical protein